MLMPNVDEQISQLAAASGKASLATTIRAGASTRSPSNTAREPSTIICGLNASTIKAKPRPIQVAASVKTVNASLSPASIASTRVRIGVSADQRDGNILLANCTRPAPEENPSHDPALP